MPNLTSLSATSPGHLLSPHISDPPSPATAKFLAMIPSGLIRTIERPAPVLYSPHTAEQQASAPLSQPEESEASAWPSDERAASAHTPLPIPTVRLRGDTVATRIQAIVQAANDSGRLHSERARRVYEFLATAALAQHVAQRPDLRTTPSRITYFIVADELPLLLNLSRATVYRALDDLKAGGLVDRRRWYTSSTLRFGGTVTAGVVVDVVLTPIQGTVARVRAEYLKQRHRNLDADRYRGRTAWKWITEVKEAQELAKILEDEAEALALRGEDHRKINSIKERALALRQSFSFPEIDAQINHLLRWTLPLFDSPPVGLTVSACQDAVYRLGDLVGAPPQQRGALIDERAQELCLATGDSGRNLRFWCWLLWRIVELEFVQPGCVSALMASLLRLMTDLREWGQDAARPLKNPGALFVSRLKASGWWEELKAAKAV